MSEELIDLAQRLKLRPDQELDKKIQLLKKRYAQTALDIHQFIEKREENIWRTWEGYYGRAKKLGDITQS